MKSGKYIIRSYMSMNYKFTGIRLQESTLTAVDWCLIINLVAKSGKVKKKEDEQRIASLAYQRIYFWLDSNLPGILAVDVENPDDMYIANLSSNIMMYCPGNPSDDLIIQLLHSKLSALAGDSLIIGEISLTGSDTSLKYTFDSDNGEYEIPDNTADYYSEGTARDTKAWWTRNDGFCYEFIRPAGIDIPDAELFRDINDPMDEFARMIAEINDNDVPGLMAEPARIVQVEKWKPKKVEE